LAWSTDHQGPHYVVFSTSFYLVPLRSKYLFQHPILTQPQPMFLPQCERPSFAPIQNNRQNYSSVYPNLYILGSKLEDKRFCTKLHQAFPDFDRVHLYFSLHSLCVLCFLSGHSCPKCQHLGSIRIGIFTQQFLSENANRNIKQPVSKSFGHSVYQFSIRCA